MTDPPHSVADALGDRVRIYLFVGETEKALDTLEPLLSCRRCRSHGPRAASPP